IGTTNGVFVKVDQTPHPGRSPSFRLLRNKCPPGDVWRPSTALPGSDGGPGPPGGLPPATPARPTSAASLRKGGGLVDVPGRGVVGADGNSGWQFSLLKALSAGRHGDILAHP